MIWVNKGEDNIYAYIRGKVILRKHNGILYRFGDFGVESTKILNRE